MRGREPWVQGPREAWPPPSSPAVGSLIDTVRRAEAIQQETLQILLFILYDPEILHRRVGEGNYLNAQFKWLNCETNSLKTDMHVLDGDNQNRFLGQYVEI